MFAQPHSQGHVLGSTQVHHSLSGRNKTTLGSGTEGTTKCLHGRGRHKDTVCPIWCRTTVLRKTTHQSRLGLPKQAVPAVTGRAVTMPGHISTGFIVQLFCPESACVEQSRQEAAGQSCALSPGSALSMQLPGNLPQNTNGKIISAGRTKHFFLEPCRSPKFCLPVVFSSRVKYILFFPSCSLLQPGVLHTFLWKPSGKLILAD